MIIVNFKLWYLVNIVLPTLFIILIFSLTIASTTMLMVHLIKGWKTRGKDGKIYS